MFPARAHTLSGRRRSAADTFTQRLRTRCRQCSGVIRSLASRSVADGKLRTSFVPTDFVAQAPDGHSKQSCRIGSIPLMAFQRLKNYFAFEARKDPVQKNDATNLNNSNARKAIQAALVIKPTGMVAMTTILRIGRSSYPTRRSRTVPGPVAVGELPVPHRSDHQVKCQLLAAI